MRYRILGPLEIDDDGRAIALPATKHRALLLALLLNRGVVCSADRLIDAVWADPPASAPKILQGYISHLRSVLGAEAIATFPTGYRLEVHPDEIDAVRFERLHAAAARASDDGNSALSGALAARALSLWRGDALADVAYDGFARGEIARLDELRLSCQLLQIDALAALGEHANVAALLSRLCAEQPSHEGLHERLALAQYRSGRQADALATLATVTLALREQLGLEPGPTVRALEHSILVHDPRLRAPATATPVRHSPTVPPAGPLIGRDADLADVIDILLRDEVRLLTICGAGGTGKTQLALEVIRRAQQYFAHGAVFVELAPITDPALIPSAIARSLGLTETAALDVDELLHEYLGGRQVLVVVDNVEHVIEGAPVLSDIVARAPWTTVLTTTRRVLHLRGELVYPLAPLQLEDAARLFVTRAAERDPRRPIDPSDPDVRAVCQRLDCLPLALEIAAVRAASIGPTRLHADLVADLGALGHGRRDAPARQQTLAATIKWSSDLLSAAERTALARLSTFASGCDLDAAFAVCEAEVGAIEGLVDWNLIQRVDADRCARIVMPETVRAHADALLDDGERRRCEALHASHYLARAEKLYEIGSAQPDTMRRLDPDIDNLRAAHDRATAAGDHDTALRLATALYPYWYVRGLFREGRARVLASLGAEDHDVALEVRAHLVLAGMHYLLGDDDAADHAARQGLVAATRIQEAPERHLMGLNTVRGVVAERRGDHQSARAHILASRTIAEALDRGLDVAIADTNLGDVALATGDIDEAERRFLAARSWHEANGTDGSFVAIGLGVAARRRSRWDDADRHFATAQEQATQNGRPHNVLLALLGRAGVAAGRGDIDAAARLLVTIDELTARTTGELFGDELADYRATEGTVVAAIGRRRLDQLRTPGDAVDVSVRPG